MEYKFVFEKLEVWQLAKELAVELYGATKKFPVEERYGLVSQINRAVISVVSNIAEGASRTSKKDRAHFYQIAYSSLMEVAAQLIIAYELTFYKFSGKCQAEGKAARNFKQTECFI